MKGPGIKTERDNVGIQQTRHDIEDVIADFKAMSVEALRKKYELGEDSRDWKVINAKADVIANDTPNRIRTVQYRPFDFQWTWYSGKTRGFIGTPGCRIGSHMTKGKNLGFITSRTVYGPDSWRDALVTKTICEFGIMATRPGNTAPIFPLYLYEDALSFDVGQKSTGTAHAPTKRPNFTNEFLKAIAAALQLPQQGTHDLPAGLTPEDIFHYAYAVFHSPGYRSRYAEFLKIDFPRLPLTGNLELFRALARLGGELVALHLLESPKLDKPRTEFISGSARASRAVAGALADESPSQKRNAGARSAAREGARAPQAEVEKISYVAHASSLRPSTPGKLEACATLGTVWIDKAQTTGFKGVPEAVWNFHVGGYQVCQKWLKDRKGRTLTRDDIVHYHKIVVALTETIRLMSEIDKVIEKRGGWPGAFATQVLDVAGKL